MGGGDKRWKIQAPNHSTVTFQFLIHSVKRSTKLQMLETEIKKNKTRKMMEMFGCTLKGKMD